MLRRDASESVSFCEGFKRHYLLHVGGIFLPFLAVMLLATPQLAFAQDSLVVTVNPRSLDIDEPQGNDGYTDGEGRIRGLQRGLGFRPGGGRENYGPRCSAPGRHHSLGQR